MEGGGGHTRGIKICQSTVDFRVRSVIRKVEMGMSWLDGESGGGAKGSGGGPKTMAEDHSESLISSGALSSLEISSESMTSTCGVCAIVMISVRLPLDLGVAIVERPGLGFFLAFKQPLRTRTGVFPIPF